MKSTQLDSKAISLSIAAVVAAISPVVKGYFDLRVEIGNNTMASVGGVNSPDLDIFSTRVWVLDDDGNEVDVDVFIDTELIEKTLNA